MQGTTPRRVLGVIGERPTGISHVRFFQPFQHLIESGIALTTLGTKLELRRTGAGWVPDERLLDDIAMVMFPQVVAAPALPNGGKLLLVEPICRMAERRGIPVVYSVDDHLGHVDALNSAYETLRDAEENRSAVLRHADSFIVTTAPLRESLGHLERPIHVLPNCIDPQRWSPRPCNSGELRLGWAGSASHLADLLMILPAIERLQSRVEFTFVLMGITERPFSVELKEIRRSWKSLGPSQRARAEAFREFAGRLRRIRHRHVPFTSMERYFSALPELDLDLAICPLLDTPFNRHKSALKFYEYAVTGSPTLASRVTPYEEELSHTVENDVDAWHDALSDSLRHREVRDRELRRQREFVLAERDACTWRDRWTIALEATLESTPESTPETAATVGGAR